MGSECYPFLFMSKLGQHIAQFLLEDFPLNEYSEKVVNQLVDKFTQENPELSTEQVKEYIKRFDQIKGNLQPDKRDISKYSWNELEQAVAANQPKRIKAGKLNDGEPKDANLIYNQDGLRVYIGKTKQACIKYGNGYNFCISSRGSDNLYHDYRHNQEGTPYFIFDDTKSSEQDENGRFIDPLHLVVVFAFKITDTDPDYPEAYSTTEANNDETDPWESFAQMVYHYPRFKRLKHLLKPVEIDPKEKAEYDTYKIYQKKINLLNNAYVKEYGDEKFWDKQYTFKDIQTANDKIDDILSGKIKPYKFNAIIEDLDQVLLGQKENKYVTIRISQNRIVKAGSDMKDEYKKFAENVLMNLAYSSVGVTLEDVLNDWDIEVKEINTLETYIKEIKELVDEYRKELAKIKLMKEGLQRLNESETGTIQEFIKYACKNLAIQNPPRSLTLSYDTNQVKDRRSFGYFDPNDSKIWVYVKNRNMADILRTLAHELVHHKQNLDGRISYESGKTGSDIENEANAKAGILLRDFGKINDEIYQ